MTNLTTADDSMGDALGPVLALAKVDCQTTSVLIVGKNSFSLLFCGGAYIAECRADARPRDSADWLGAC